MSSTCCSPSEMVAHGCSNPTSPGASALVRAISACCGRRTGPVSSSPEWAGCRASGHRFERGSRAGTSSLTSHAWKTCPRMAGWFCSERAPRRICFPCAWTARPEDRVPRTVQTGKLVSNVQLLSRRALDRLSGRRTRDRKSASTFSSFPALPCRSRSTSSGESPVWGRTAGKSCIWIKTASGRSA